MARINGFRRKTGGRLIITDDIVILPLLARHTVAFFPVFSLHGSFFLLYLLDLRVFIFNGFHRPGVFEVNYDLCGSRLSDLSIN